MISKDLPLCKKINSTAYDQQIGFALLSKKVRNNSDIFTCTMTNLIKSRMIGAMPFKPMLFT